MYKVQLITNTLEQYFCSLTITDLYVIVICVFVLLTYQYLVFTSVFLFWMMFIIVNYFLSNSLLKYIYILHTTKDCYDAINSNSKQFVSHEYVSAKELWDKA